MTARDFCFWLQGKLEIDAAEHGAESNTTRAMSSAQVAVIKRHLALVFAHDIDPQANAKTGKSVLDAIHHGPTGEKVGNTIMRC